jgi:hypothetical protein
MRMLHRLLADEVEPAVMKAQATIDKLPEAARKVCHWTMSLCC